jgi:uncharacterized phiE125 gp8 family phage protein
MPIYAGQHDPSDVADYLVRFDDLLETAETLTILSISLDAGAASVGLALGAGPYAAFGLDKAVRFWLTCSQPNNAAFAAGVAATITATIGTNNSPARTFQRSVTVLVQQSDAKAAPVTLADAKAHLRVVGNDDDTYITSLIAAAGLKIERDTGLIVTGVRSVIAAQRDWGVMHEVVLRRRPVVSVDSVQYRAVTGAVTTLAADQYRLETPAFGLSLIVPAFDAVWPELEATRGAVRATYSAGYATAEAVPADVRHAALVLIGHWYEHREAVVAGAAPVVVPLAYDALIAPHRTELVG